MQEIERLSNSAIENYNCPFYYACTNILGLVGGTSRPARIGLASHVIIATYVEAILEEKVTENWEKFDQIVASTLSKQPDIRDEAEADILGNFIGKQFNPDQIYGVEMKLAVDWDGSPIPYEEQRGFRGILDLVELVDRRAYISDWKTGRVKPPKAALETDQQLWRYAWLLWSHLGGNVEDFVLYLYYLRYGGDPIDVSVSVDRMLETTPENVRTIRDGINERVRAYVSASAGSSEVCYETLAHHFPAKPCSQCAFCTLRCPLAGTPLEPERPTTVEDAVALLERYQVLNSELDRIFTFLEWAAQEHGTIAGAGVFAGFDGRDTTGYDEDMVVAVCREAKIPTDLYMRPLSPAKLRELVQKTPALREKLGQPKVFPGNIKFNIRSRG